MRGAGPLAGRRVVVTRPVEQAGALVAALQALGAEAVLRPAIDVRRVEDPTALDAALSRLATYEWVVFTSANGVRAAWERFAALGRGLEELLEDGEHGRRPGAPQIAAIGPGTAGALERRGARPDFVPREYVAEALAADLPDVEGRAVLLLRADIARPALPEILMERGARVDDVPAYRTVAESTPAPATVGDSAPADAVTFTSPSTVRGYLARYGGVRSAVVACIGPVTARAAREAGLRVDVVAERYTVPGLLAALLEHFAPGSELATTGPPPLAGPRAAALPCEDAR